MKVKAKGFSQSPIVVDVTLLERIGVVCEWMASRNIELIAKKYGVTIDALLGPKCEEFGEEALKLRLGQSAVADGNTASYDWSLKDERSFSVSKMGMLLEGLCNSPGRIRSISISYGILQNVGMHISFSNETFSSWYSVEGEEASVAHVHRVLQDIVSDAGVDYPMLHKWLPAALVRVCAGIAGFILYAKLLSLIKLQVNVEVYQISLALWGLPVAASSTFLVDPVVKYIKDAYPKCEFSFGNEARRATARRNAVVLIVSTVAIPIVLGVFRLT